MVARRRRSAADVLATAEERGFNLRDFGDGTIGIALDETTTREDVAQLLAAFGIEGADVDALAARADLRLPEALERRSPFLEHPVFHRHHGEHQVQDDRVERGIGKREMAGVHHTRVHAEPEGRRTIPQPLEHGGRDVHGGEMHPGRETGQIEPGARARDQHTVAGTQLQPLDRTPPRCIEAGYRGGDAVIDRRPERVPDAVPHGGGAQSVTRHPLGIGQLEQDQAQDRRVGRGAGIARLGRQDLRLIERGLGEREVPGLGKRLPHREEHLAAFRMVKREQL